MRAAQRLLAVAKGNYLTPYAATGLTGIITHPAPRPHLMYLYYLTLERLKTFPESSVYRQSTEALTKHRLSIVEQAKPPGLDEFLQSIDKQVEDHPKAFSEKGPAQILEAAGKKFYIPRVPSKRIEKNIEWDGEAIASKSEGPLDSEELGVLLDDLKKPSPMLGTDEADVQVDTEPALTTEQVSEIETQIGGGLIEEVVRCAENELRVVNLMAQAKPWEELEEKPEPGQWDYFQRDSHTAGTQSPPSK